MEELAGWLGEAVTDLGVGPRDAPDRQRTLRATIEWSYRTLDEPLQRSFVKFAVFAGGATLEAAQAVTGADLATVDTLITAGIATSRAEIMRWALGRIREHPAYAQLQERVHEIDELKAQF